MRWMTHQTAAVGTALALHLPLAGVIAACAGGVFPDRIDMALASLSRNRQKAFNRIHRGTTHWFGWWLGILLLGMGAGAVPVLGDLPEIAHSLVMGFGFGGLSHVILDMLNPHGVPLSPFSRRPTVSLKVCSTGTWGEHVFLGCMLVAFVLLLGPEARRLIFETERMLGGILTFR